MSNLTPTGTGSKAEPIAQKTTAVQAVAPVEESMRNLSLNQPQVIKHEPIIEKEVIEETKHQVQKVHHIQPVIHETERHIQPVIKTQVSAEKVFIERDTNVMMPPIIEKPKEMGGLEPVEKVAPEGVIHKPRLEKEVVIEHPVRVKREHHIQPIIHEREHHIQPIIKQEGSAEQRVVEQQRTVLLPPVIEPPEILTAPTQAKVAPIPPPKPTDVPVVATSTSAPEEIEPRLVPPPVGAVSTTVVTPDTTGRGTTKLTTITKPLPVPTVPAPGGTPPLAAGALPLAGGVPAPAVTPAAQPTAPGKASLGKKLKGAVKELQGTITRSAAKKEEGRMLKHGVDPAAASATSSNRPL